VEEYIKNAVAFQVAALREKRGWTQAQLGRRAEKPQNVISRIENPEYGKATIRTLLDIAAAFDVALSVRFVSFSDLLSQMRLVSPEDLAVPSFDEEQSVRQIHSGTLEAFTAPKFQNSDDSDQCFGFRTAEERGAKAAGLSSLVSRPLARERYEAGKYQIG